MRTFGSGCLLDSGVATTTAMLARRRHGTLHHAFGKIKMTLISWGKAAARSCSRCRRPLEAARSANMTVW
jgi:hypothetical protein